MQDQIPAIRYTPTLSLNLKTTTTSTELYFEANWLKENGTCPYYYWSEDIELCGLFQYSTIPMFNLIRLLETGRV